MKAKITAQSLWLLLVTVGIVHYAKNDPAVLALKWADFLSWPLVFSLASLMAAKFFLGVAAQDSTAAIDQSISLKKMLHTYVTTDMAKYLPGGVWASAGRIKLYRDWGMEKKQIAKAFALENYLLFASSLLLGFLFIIQSESSALMDSPAGNLVRDFRGLISTFLVVAWFVSLYLGLRYLGSEVRARRLIFKTVAVQLLVCVLLGLQTAFLSPTALTFELAMTYIGAFALARLAGYLAIFAPAGIGVREYVFIQSFPVGMHADAIAVAAICRVSTFVFEAALFAVTVVSARIYRKKMGLIPGLK